MNSRKFCVILSSLILCFLLVVFPILGNKFFSNFGLKSLIFLSSLVIYYNVSKIFKQYLLLLLSIFFYLSFGLNFLVLIFASIVISYLFINAILRTKKNSKFLLVCAITCSLLPLLFFKYFNFISISITQLFDTVGIKLDPFTLKLLVPIGISFYTFKIISCLIDVYKDKIAKESINFVNYALYVSFFPQIVCGPIERFDKFSSEIQKDRNFSWNNLECAAKLLILGAFKKYAIADFLGIYVNNVFESVESKNGLTLLLASFFFSIQLYCDFSGYTDMALGISKSFGLNLTDNFRRPYFSKNVKEFWARWHISLSTWLRDYIYIPLGGNRCSSVRKHLNILITFFVSGLWHGANWTFIVWGLLHGFAIMLHDVFFPKNKNAGSTNRFVSFVNILFTFAFVNFAWIIFRAESLNKFIEIIKGIFTRFSLSFSAISRIFLPFIRENTAIAHFLIAVQFIALLFLFEYYKEKNFKKFEKFNFIFYALLLAIVLLFGQFTGANFIYAQF